MTVPTGGKRPTTVRLRSFIPHGESRAIIEQATSKDASAPTQGQTAVEQVAAPLRGRAMVVIGGLSRPEHVENLRKAFELSEVIWPHTREHDATVDAFESHIARADVAVVLLLIRWARHGHGDVQGLCERHGKAFVRVPGGYHPDQVAPLIIEQCGVRLRERSP